MRSLTCCVRVAVRCLSVNLYVRPFLRKQHSETTHYWSIVTYLEQDIRHRATRLARLGLLPTFFGQSMSGVFKQK
jgi:hypothetical protein